MSLEFPTQPPTETDRRLERLRGCFEAYMHDFPLTEQELQGRLLDVGAAKAEFTQYVRERFHNPEAKAVELIERHIDPGNEGWHIHASGLRLPFADNSFDAVTARHCISNFTSEKFISELLRVVRKGGRVMCTMITPERERALQADLQERFGEEYNVEVIDGVEHSEDWEGRIEAAENLRMFLHVLSSEHSVEIIGEGLDIVIITK